MESVAFSSPMGSPFSQTLQSLKCASTTYNFLSFSDSIRASASSSSSSLLSKTNGPRLFNARFKLSCQPCGRVTKASAVQASTAEPDAHKDIPISDIVEKLVNADGVPQDTKLYIGNLPYNVDSAELARIVQGYAVPELIEVIYNRDTGISKGFAFVTMSTVEECNVIIENLDGALYQGRPLRVNMAAKPASASQPLYRESEHKLFIGNMSWTVTSETLRNVFEKFGEVVDARVVYDGETGKSRGYGFVCYSNRDEMESALKKLDGEELEGRSLRVGLATGRRARYDQSD